MITIIQAVGRVPPGRSYRALEIKLQECDRNVRDEYEHTLSGAKRSERDTSPLSEIIIIAAEMKRAIDSAEKTAAPVSISKRMDGYIGRYTVKKY